MTNVEVVPLARPIAPLSLPQSPAVRADDRFPGSLVPHHGAQSLTPPPIPAHLADQLTPVRTDHAAVASAICGMTAVIPIVSQVAGLALGLMALRRIRRARQAGVIIGGRRYALTGILSSGLALAGWLVFGGLMVGVNQTLAHTLNPLTSLSLLSR